MGLQVLGGRLSKFPSESVLAHRPVGCPLIPKPRGVSRTNDPRVSHPRRLFPPPPRVTTGDLDLPEATPRRRPLVVSPVGSRPSPGAPREKGVSEGMTGGLRLGPTHILPDTILVGYLAREVDRLVLPGFPYLALRPVRTVTPNFSPASVRVVHASFSYSTQLGSDPFHDNLVSFRHTRRQKKEI